jgi:hypothetical protein
MAEPIGRYYAVYFAQLSAAIDYCQQLVPHVVRVLRATPAGEDRPAVWLYVPPRSEGSLRDGGYLFLSPGAVHAAIAGAMDAPLGGQVSRRSLPPKAVLVLGEDIAQRGAVVAERVDATHGEPAVSNRADDIRAGIDTAPAGTTVEVSGQR